MAAAVARATGRAKAPPWRATRVHDHELAVAVLRYYTLFIKPHALQWHWPP